MDTPLTDDNSLTLADAVQVNHSLEDETIDKNAEHSKSNYGALWSVLQAIERTVQ